MQRMHERALKALAVYLGLGDKRSLRLLEGHLRGQAAPVGLATLKRWSIKFGWAGEVAKYSREISFEIARDSIEGLEARAFGDLAVVRQAKYRCIEELLRDPNDPSLSAAQRRRLMNPTPLDYCRLLKMEHQLLKCCAARGESVSARRDEAPSRMAEFLAEADLPDLTMKPPNPLSSVVRGAATPSPAPRAGPASPLPFSPIEVAGPDSTITTSARVELPVAPDGLRVEVTVVPTREAPNQATVVAQLKNDPMVSDLAVERGASSDARVIYRVVLRSAAAAGRARIVDLIRGAYGANARTLNTVETRLIRDCRPLERRVVADAIGQARARAAAQATSDHLRLVRLLLAVELPFGADFDGCFDHAAAPALRFLPGYASTDELNVWGAVSLTFRTQPER